MELQMEQISIPNYFKELNKELSYEKLFLNKLKEIKTNDDKIYEIQIQVQINRINKRIELINTEIEQLKEIVQAESQNNNNESKVEEQTSSKETVSEKNEEKKNRTKRFS